MSSLQLLRVQLLETILKISKDFKSPTIVLNIETFTLCLRCWFECIIYANYILFVFIMFTFYMSKMSGYLNKCLFEYLYFNLYIYLASIYIWIFKCIFGYVSVYLNQCIFCYSYINIFDLMFIWGYICLFDLIHIWVYIHKYIWSYSNLYISFWNQSLYSN